ncbi:MAG: CDP-diacylglycerol--serine O-phosphatidyltransferase [Bacteroidaceae bacterium]|nr:CDP-diacylglycerol--serine O-phosphatidyltransferase [Prevotellaceae bacterium]MDY5631526.1 CDP-diacylglycerol--serine O-phosphatidyltransferase [Bacteroidaceae bacterium]
MKRHIPNAITCCNLMCGCMATFLAFNATQYPRYFVLAVIAIIAGAVFDFFDGMVARLLNVSSPIGKELDSLADVITFGVAPSALVFSLFQQVQYPESVDFLRKVLPYSAFLMAAFSALRLAKFNLDTRQTTSFIGLPTPANALFWGSIIIGQYPFLTSGRFNALFLLAFMILFCWLMVAEIPLFALKFKNLSWAENKIKYIFLAGCLPLLLLGYSALAAIIVWYVALSIYEVRRAAH